MQARENGDDRDEAFAALLVVRAGLLGQLADGDLLSAAPGDDGPADTSLASDMRAKARRDLAAAERVLASALREFGWGGHGSDPRSPLANLYLPGVELLARVRLKRGAAREKTAA